MAEIKQTTILSAGKNMEPPGPHLWQKGRKLLQLLWETGWAVLPKQNMLYPMAQGHGIYPVPFLSVYQ